MTVPIMFQVVFFMPALTALAVRIDVDHEVSDASTTATTTTTTNKTKNHEVVTCRYDSSQVFSVNYQEPGGRALSEENWTHVGGKPNRPHMSQKERLKSLSRVLAVAASFFKDHLPDVKWWLTHGSLIGAVRNGNIIPWDLDVDISVDETTFFAVATWKFLNAMDLPTYENLLGGFGVKVADDVIFVVGKGHFESDSSLLQQDAMEWPGRFVDLKTGYFVEILNTDKTPAEKVKQCKIGDVEVPIPEDPIAYLAEGDTYPDSIRVDEPKGIKLVSTSKMSCTVRQCVVPEDSAEPASSASSDPFAMTFVRRRESDDDGDGSFTLVSGITLGEDCGEAKSDDIPDVWVHPVCL